MMANSHLATVDQLEYLGNKSKEYTDKVVGDLKTKVDDIITTGGEPNTIEGIKVNGEIITPDSDKVVDLGQILTPEEIEDGINYTLERGHYSSIYWFGSLEQAKQYVEEYYEFKDLVDSGSDPIDILPNYDVMVTMDYTNDPERVLFEIDGKEPEFYVYFNSVFTEKVTNEDSTVEHVVIRPAGFYKVGDNSPIKTIKVNGEVVTPDEDKAIDLEIPTADDITTAVDEAIAAVDHLKRKIVDSVDDIDPEADDADQYIYMVQKTDSADGDSYDEYMVIDGVVEKVGDWKVDLSDYVTKDMIATDEEVATIIDAVFNPVETPTE